jgi:hypothetical protein
MSSCPRRLIQATVQFLSESAIYHSTGLKTAGSLPAAPLSDFASGFSTRAKTGATRETVPAVSS